MGKFGGSGGSSDSDDGVTAGGSRRSGRSVRGDRGASVPSPFHRERETSPDAHHAHSTRPTHCETDPSNLLCCVPHARSVRSWTLLLLETLFISARWHVERLCRTAAISRGSACASGGPMIADIMQALSSNSMPRQVSTGWHMRMAEFDELLNGGSLYGHCTHATVESSLENVYAYGRSISGPSCPSSTTSLRRNHPRSLFNAQYMESGTHRSVRLNNPNIRWEIQEDQGSPASSNTEMAASSIEPPAAAAPEPSSAVQMEEVEEIGAISTSTVKQRPRNQSMLLAAAASTVLTAVDQSNDGRPLRIFSQAGNYSSVSGSAPMDPRVAMDPQLRDTEGLDRSSTHPKFLHSNATSHSWALGAIAELLDNSMDMHTPQHPVTIHVDVKSCPETAGGRMLVVRDNGGGMTKREMLQMMSFGVSRQTTEQRIGRYGNGFKSSSMRLGADALVLSVSRATGSFTAGLLSYTFLRETNAQEVKVPLIKWGANGKPLPGLDAAALANRQRALAKLLKWGPGYDEARLLAELRKLRPFGTAVLVYNLWQTDDGEQELDFFTDSKDIRLRPPAEDDDDGGGKSRKKGSCARTAKGAAAKEKYYGHKVSLRAYASILYLSHPPGFSIVLRGSRVEPRNLKKDLKYKKVENYQPRPRSLPARIFTCGDAKAPGSLRGRCCSRAASQGSKCLRQATRVRTRSGRARTRSPSGSSRKRLMPT